METQRPRPVRGALVRLWYLHLRLKAELEDVKKAPHTFTQLWCGGKGVIR
ncbi:MAG: hypothetical protein QXR87_06825 [Candidatus Hadarchaeales archaeon]